LLVLIDLGTNVYEEAKPVMQGDSKQGEQKRRDAFNKSRRRRFLVLRGGNEGFEEDPPKKRV